MYTEMNDPNAKSWQQIIFLKYASCKFNFSSRMQKICVKHGLLNIQSKIIKILYLQTSVFVSKIIVVFLVLSFVINYFFVENVQCIFDSSQTSTKFMVALNCLVTYGSEKIWLNLWETWRRRKENIWVHRQT